MPDLWLDMGQQGSKIRFNFEMVWSSPPFFIFPFLFISFLPFFLTSSLSTPFLSFFLCPSIFFHSSGIGCGDRSPSKDAQTFQLLRGNPELFPDHSRIIVTPACLRSYYQIPPCEHAWNTSQGTFPSRPEARATLTGSSLCRRPAALLQAPPHL